jgi:hypothetical protein
MDDETVEGVSHVRDFEEVRQMQVLLEKFVGARVFEHTFFPALWAIGLFMENIHQVQSKPHFMMPKPSGPRFLLYIDSSGQTYIRNMTQHFFLVDTDPAVQFISSDGRAITDTVLDGIFTREKNAENNAGKLTFFHLRCFPMQWARHHENERFSTHRICQGNFMNTSSNKNSYKNVSF